MAISLLLALCVGAVLGITGAGGGMAVLRTSTAENQPLYPATLHQHSGRFIWRINTWLLFLALGALTGFMTGLLAVGGGFILVPLLL